MNLTTDRISRGNKVSSLITARILGGSGPCYRESFFQEEDNCVWMHALVLVKALLW